MREATFLYCLAFLFAYEENFTEALRYYTQANHSPCAQHIVVEVEEFLCWIIELEPTKVHLKFFLGLINLHKPDDESAYREFNEFLHEQESDRFPMLQDKARKFIDDIESKAVVRLCQRTLPAAGTADGVAAQGRMAEPYI